MMKQLYFLMFLSAIATADNVDLEEMLSEGSTGFTGNFLSEVIKADPGKSLVVSAFSVMTPLALLSLASVGPSHDELLKAIGLPNDDVTKAVFPLVESKLKSNENIDLKSATNIYIPLKYELNPDFDVMARNVFGSEIKNIDFMNSVQSANIINSWVDNQTNHLITEVVSPDSIMSDTRAIIVNALYFKGTWETQFSKSSTQDSDFHVTNEEVIQVPMMHVQENFKYAESENLQSKILVMPYTGEHSYMVIVLPYEIDGIQHVAEKLKDLSLLYETFDEVQVEVSLPKFTIETTIDLIEILQQMNITKLFNPQEANLAKLLKDSKDLCVSTATQKAFIEVDEKGATASAANGFEIFLIGPLAPDPVYEFNADHPFMFFLYVQDYILFSGIYYG